MTRLPMHKGSRLFAWLAVTFLFLPVGTSAATSVGTPPEISVSASNAGSIIVHYTPAGGFVSMGALIRAQAAVPVRSDVYVGILSPDGQAISWIGDPEAPTLAEGPPVPFLKGVVLAADASFKLTVPNFAVGAPQGWYTLYGLVVVADQHPADARNWLSASFFPLQVLPASSQ